MSKLNEKYCEKCDLQYIDDRYLHCCYCMKNYECSMRDKNIYCCYCKKKYSNKEFNANHLMCRYKEHSFIEIVNNTNCCFCSNYGVILPNKYWIDLHNNKLLNYNPSSQFNRDINDFFDNQIINLHKSKITSSIFNKFLNNKHIKPCQSIFNKIYTHSKLNKLPINLINKIYYYTVPQCCQILFKHSENEDIFIIPIIKKNLINNIYNVNKAVFFHNINSVVYYSNKLDININFDSRYDILSRRIEKRERRDKKFRIYSSSRYRLQHNITAHFINL